MYSVYPYSPGSLAVFASLWESYPKQTNLFVVSESVFSQAAMLAKACVLKIGLAAAMPRVYTCTLYSSRCIYCSGVVYSRIFHSVTSLYFDSIAAVHLA